MHISAGVHRGQRHWILQDLELQAAVRHWTWMSGPLEGQRVLLTAEPSFQSIVPGL